MNFKQRTWEIVEAAKPGDTLSRLFDVSILTLIFLNVFAVILESVESVQLQSGDFFPWFEAVSVSVFTVEYLARIWSCVKDDRYKGAFRGRLRFARSFMAVVDLLAILPFYLPIFGMDLRFVRVFRLLRIVRVAKIGRYYSSLNLIRRVVGSKKEELVLATALMILLLVVASSLLYYAENAAQPDKFPNIPAAMWWGVSTLTTVGYGDVCPVTVVGKVVASVIAMLGIGMFALPTGILGAGFVEEVQRRKAKRKNCPHCGKPID